MTWLPKRNVVVPIDFSAASPEAVATALELVSSPVHVHVVHALTPLEAMSPGVMWGTMDDASREKAVREYFGHFAAEHGFTGVDLTVRFGDPGTEITDFAREINADLIVVPSHGRHGIKRLLLGSVAERILRHAHCPVLVLRRPDAD